jgi:hypothetical protein
MPCNAVGGDTFEFLRDLPRADFPSQCKFNSSTFGMFADPATAPHSLSPQIPDFTAEPGPTHQVKNIANSWCEQSLLGHFGIHSRNETRIYKESAKREVNVFGLISRKSPIR